MVRGPDAVSLKLESLEVRDVPAILLDAALNAARTDAAPLGGLVNITEVQLAMTNSLVTRSNTAAPRVVKSASAADSLTFSLSGTTLTIRSSDGIFGRLTNSTLSNPPFVSYGTTLTIPDVTGLNVDLLLGGNDTVLDNTPFATQINGGPGNDSISTPGMDFDPLAFFLFTQPGGPNPALASLLGGPTKALFGGDGNDVISVPGMANGFVLDGGAGDDTINGPVFGFFNFLNGGRGNDTITGGFGLDILISGGGSDTLNGNGGRDVYFAQDADGDVILNLPGEFVIADPFDLRAF